MAWVAKYSGDLKSLLIWDSDNGDLWVHYFKLTQNTFEASFDLLFVTYSSNLGESGSQFEICPQGEITNLCNPSRIVDESPKLWFEVEVFNLEARIAIAGRVFL